MFQKEKRRKWVFGRFKKKRLALITAPTQLKERSPSEEGEEQSKHIMTDAIATVEYAESADPCLEETKEILVVETQIETIQSTKQSETEIQDSSAIKIQTAFRGYLVSLFKLFSLLSHQNNNFLLLLSITFIFIANKIS